MPQTVSCPRALATPATTTRLCLTARPARLSSAVSARVAARGSQALVFLHEEDEPFQLCYTRATCGPYAENLHCVLWVVEGHPISGYADGDDAPDKRLELVPGTGNRGPASMPFRPTLLGWCILEVTLPW